MGPVEDEASVVYLRPETAQGSTSTSRTSSRARARRSRSGSPRSASRFRNEISPGNFVFRMREFEQMEMQYFVRPGDAAAAAFEDWLPAPQGLVRAATASRPSGSACASTPRTSWPTTPRRPSTSSTASRSAGRSSRASTTAATSTSSRHAEASGENLEYFDPATEEHFIPWVVETAAGADRAAFTFLIDAYREEEVRGETARVAVPPP